jgi:hydroxysqualene dehydroxylase
MPNARVIGAGLAGLSAAVELAGAGWSVSIDEAAARAGGRCRSYRDPKLDMVIDNGNHLVFSGNRAVGAYLKTIGAADRLTGPDHCVFDFHDLRDGARWRLAPNDGPVPWWLFDAKRRTPGASISDHMALAQLVWAGAGDRVDALLPTKGALWERLAEPVLLAALNVAPAQGSARLAGRVIAESLARGGAASRPMIATPTLDAAFVDPALEWLAFKRAAPKFGRRLRSMTFAGDRVTALDFGDGAEPISGESVILAVPPWIAAELVPGLIVPDRHSAILNAHFACPAPKDARRMIALIGGLAEWVFAFDDRISVTISGADAVVDQDRAALAKCIWADVAATLGLTDALPRWQIVKEKRATFAATPEQDALRPGAATRWSNLFLAGDWTQTDLPATIEGALRSGVTAAGLAMRANTA